MTLIKFVPERVGSSFIASENNPSLEFPPSCYKGPPICNLKDFSVELPKIGNGILQSLGTRERERTFQMCLKVELEEAGVVKVQVESEIDLIYKGVRVGGRRADLVVHLQSGEKAVIEVKAVSDLNVNHSEQLHFYMHAMNIDRGYLINFPNVQQDGFPYMGKSIVDFCLKNIQGVLDVDRLMPRWAFRRSTSLSCVQVVEATTRRVCKGNEELEALAMKKAVQKETQQPKYAIATSTGKTCKVCIKSGGAQYCRFHKKKTQLYL